MAIAKIKKVQILAHKSNQEAVLSCLQDSGLVEITKVEQVMLPAEYVPEQLLDFDNRLHSLKETIDNLSLYEVTKSRLIGSLFKPRPVIQPEVIEQAASSSQYKQILVEIKDKQARIRQLENQMQRVNSEKELLYPWRSVNLRIQDLLPRKYTHTFLGVINQADYLQFAQEIKTKRPPVFFEIVNPVRKISSNRAGLSNRVNQIKKQRDLIVVFLIENEEEIKEILRQHNFNFFILPESLKEKKLLSLTVRHCLDLFEERLSQLRSELLKLKDEIKKLLPQKVLLMGLYDYFFNSRSRLLAVQNLGTTRQAFLLEGWVRESDLADLEVRLESFPSLVMFSRPALPSEDAPVGLENKPYFAPFEIVTSLYGMPARYSVDPTPLLAPFFFIFFGLCLTDAGYGLIIAVATFILLRRLRLTKPARRILNFFFLCGVSTIILGTLIGGWFGIPIKKLMLFDPMKNPLIFLLIALGLGFIQVEFGILIRMIQDIRQRQFIDALLVRLAWLLILPSLFLIFMKVTWAKNVAIIAAVSIVLFSNYRVKNIFTRLGAGLYSLYDVMRYLADVLSYSRLLALGLSTSVIAMVINTLSRQALNIPLVGGIVMVFILILGHLFNLAINTLSGFVHSARLQFVEFFSKFFVGGGRPVRPFKRERIYCG